MNKISSVAVYCRVSTDSKDQLNSYNNQKDFFYNFISHKAEFKLYRIYADHGISGTATKNRTQFNKMISDAKEGKFSVILTKEVSRFARNTLDVIYFTRLLKSYDVNVIFLSDGIDTSTPDAELRLSIMGSLAQDESRKISERVKFGQRLSMQKGVVFGKAPLGYEIENKKLVINNREAETVKLIFDMFTESHYSRSEIARILIKNRIFTKNNTLNWSASSVSKILKNEKYCGDLIQQKTYTPSFLEHKSIKNNGTEPLITIYDNHTPLISREKFLKAQSMFKIPKRQIKHTQNTANAFYCGECGQPLTRHKRQNGQYVYRCSSFVSGGKAKCLAGNQLSEQILLKAFDIISTFYKENSSLLKLKDEILKIVIKSKNYCKSKISKTDDALKILRQNIDNDTFFDICRLLKRSENPEILDTDDIKLKIAEAINEIKNDLTLFSKVTLFKDRIFQIETSLGSVFKFKLLKKSDKRNKAPTSVNRPFISG